MNLLIFRGRIGRTLVGAMICLALPLGTACQESETAKPAAVKFREADYQRAWIATRGGKSEVRMRDGTRADIVTTTHVIEVDFAEKWAESIGQSLHYALQTGLKAGVLLIVDETDDERYLVRWRSVVTENRLPIDLFLIDSHFVIQAAP